MSSAEPAAPCCAQCGKPIDDHDQYCRHCGEPAHHRRRDDRDRFPATWLLLLVVLALVILAFIAGLLINRGDEDHTTSRVLVCSRQDDRHHGHRCAVPGPPTSPPVIVTGGALITNCSDTALVSSIKQLCSVELSNNTNVDLTIIEPLPGTSSPPTPTTSGPPTPTPVPTSPNLPG
jgi:predicted nucleic acid-binding Zn ribbon protein